MFVFPSVRYPTKIPYSISFLISDPPPQEILSPQKLPWKGSESQGLGVATHKDVRCLTSFVSNTTWRDSSNKVTIGLFVCVNVVSSFISISALPPFFSRLLLRFTIVPAIISSSTSSKSSFNKLTNVIFFTPRLSLSSWLSLPEMSLSFHGTSRFISGFITVYQSNAPPFSSIQSTLHTQYI